MRTISDADANRDFSGLLRDVAAGESVLILSRGAPVARLSPVGDESSRMEAREALLYRLKGQNATGQRVWTREELYVE